MQSYFYDTADYLKSILTQGENFLCNYLGESSDFVRLNHNKIRQSGNATQHYLDITLLKGERSAEGAIALSGRKEDDQQSIRATLENLRKTIEVVPDDPHLLYATEVNSTEMKNENTLPDSQNALTEIMEAASGLDLVGIYASGGITAGFANSFGQRNWYETYSFNFDWSLYHSTDKAVKCSYAGTKWDSSELKNKMSTARSQLAILGKEPKTVKPGKYRAYLTPSALSEIAQMMCWGGFGIKDHKTKQTIFIKMIEEGKKLHPSLTFRENSKEGTDPNFQAEGYLKPDHVTLIEKGTYKDTLVSPRSSKEYGVPTNGAQNWEIPGSIEISAGDLARDDILKELGTGVYINNLWYLNFSDRPACRMTGMTRFATFWVENGEIVAPMNVMRFDDSVYRILGDNLESLTQERDFMMDPSSYHHRSTDSIHLPGALVRDFEFTL